MRISERFRSLFILLILPVSFSFVAGCGVSSGKKPTETDRPEASSTERSQEQSPNGSTVPFTLSGRKFIELNVRLNDGDPSTFLLFPTFRRSYLFRGKQGNQPLGLSGVSSDEGKVAIDRIRVGSYTVRDLEMPRVRRRDLRRRSPVLRKQEMTSYAGVIGQDVLDGARLTIHYPKKKLHLQRPGVRGRGSDRAPVEPGQMSFRIIEAAMTRRLMVIEAGVNGMYRGQFALMPGMPVNLLDESSVEKWELSTLSDDKLRRRYGLSSSSFQFLEVDRFWCGGRTFRTVLFRVSNQMKRNMSLEAEGVLGYIFLKDKVLQIDFANRWVSLMEP